MRAMCDHSPAEPTLTDNRPMDNLPVSVYQKVLVAARSLELKPAGENL